ncbi:hypothetical protein D9X30_4080 [Cupriavidus sp. U2]|nr:hypothetical protein D9X30_4080 [Cupriavidus sp. U2]
MGGVANGKEGMVRNILHIVAGIVFIMLSKSQFAAETGDTSIDGTAIRPGCAVVFEREFLHQSAGSLGATPFFVLPIWTCDDQRVLIDRYDINGASPEVVEGVLLKNQALVVLVRWSISSRAADFSGHFYRVFIYRHIALDGADACIRDCYGMGAFPEGWDGTWKNGKSAVFQYKDANSIVRKLSKVWKNLDVPEVKEKQRLNN